MFNYLFKPFTHDLKNKIVMFAWVLLLLSACQSQSVENTMPNTNATSSTDENTNKFSQFEQQVAQRMSLDIRYYCDDVAGKPSVPSSKHCRKALTKLPTALAQLISETNLGGIVLFAENVQSTEQIIHLTHDIQAAALNSSTEKPLIISIDQEGGRVARFSKMTGFSGNMAIGASYTKHGNTFAAEVNKVIAQELKLLGINNNYAPVVDVNTDVNNPVINTRSFGESAGQVAELGVNAVNAIQSEGIMATLKHFPGHGDTHVDSHIGLPRVDHDRETISKIDLAPFALAIQESDPAMVMTAHIQYPALDNSYIVSKSGEQVIRPATMSRKILTDLLRNEMGFNGIIATDALDMAGVTHIFSEVDAVVETFVAGADLAVMPYKVRTPSDVNHFYAFIKQVAQSLQQHIDREEYSIDEFELSLARLNSYKQRYIDLPKESISAQITNAQRLIASDEHLETEQALANAALTLIKNAKENKPVIPLAITSTKNIHVVTENPQELDALQYAVSKVFLAQASDISSTEEVDIRTGEISQADILIATLDIKTASLVDLGGMDDLTPSYGSAASQKEKLTYATVLKRQLTEAKHLNIPSILIVKGSPFLLKEYRELADVILLNFDDRIYFTANQQAISPGMNASIAAVFDQLEISGKLPVTIQ